MDDRWPSFATWYAGAYPRLAAALTVVGRDRELARDAAAEACARAWERWERVGAMNAPDGWTYRVGVNVLRRLQRRATVERRLLRRVGVTPEVAPADLDPRVWAAVRALPARQREAIVLRHSSTFSSDPGLSFIRPDAYSIMPPSYFHPPLVCHSTRGGSRGLTAVSSIP